MLVTTASAFAIDKDQLIQMAKLGLDDKAIIAAIDSSGPNELKLSKEELGELRLQGVSDTVIAHLKASGRVDGGDATAPADPDGPAPPDGDTSLEPAPAPAEGETEEDRLEREAEEKAREKEILEKAKEINQQQKQEDFRKGKLQGLARKLRARKRAHRSAPGQSQAQLFGVCGVVGDEERIKLGRQVPAKGSICVQRHNLLCKPGPHRRRQKPPVRVRILPYHPAGDGKRSPLRVHRHKARPECIRERPAVLF